MIQKGSTNVEQPIRKDKTQQGGAKTVRTFKGTQAEMTTLGNTYYNDGYDISLTAGPVWTLQVEFAGDDEQQEEEPKWTWELLASSGNKDLLYSTNPLVLNLSTENRNLIVDFFKNPSKSGAAIPTFTGTTEEIVQAEATWVMMLIGVRQVDFHAPILRRSYTCSTTYQIMDAMSYIESIHSTDTMIAVEEIPDTIASVLPNDDQPTIQTIKYTRGGVEEAVDVTFHYGWLKHYPSIQAVSDGKLQVSQEYTYGQWPVPVYGYPI